MTIKTFRGKLDHQDIDEIRLRTNDGRVGYKIVKFELMAHQMGVAVDSCVKIFKTTPGASTSVIDLEDMDLLAVGANYNATYEIDHIVIFDNEIVNQNIFIQHHQSTGATAVNYYLELEQMILDGNESTMATLQSIRSSYESYRPAGPT